MYLHVMGYNHAFLPIEQIKVDMSVCIQIRVLLFLRSCDVL